MKNQKIHLLLLISVLSLFLLSCSSSAKLVLANDASFSKYKYVCFGEKVTGDRDLDDIVMLVQNEISNTGLQQISLKNAPKDYLNCTLTPNIHVKSEKWDGGYTYITITFYDYNTDQSIGVIKSSGKGISISQDQKLALKALRKKLQKVFGVKKSTNLTTD